MWFNDINDGLAQTFVTLHILLLLTQGAVSQSDCNFYQNLQPEKTYYVYNREYPEHYVGKTDCIWQAVSQEAIQLNCTVEMPESSNCNKDQLSIQHANSIVNKLCGSGTSVSEGYNVTIRLDSPKSTQGGRFMCELKAKKPRENCHCGLRKMPRIVGGNETGVNEYPMMAALLDSRTRVVYCGATIISSNHVITAATCVHSNDVSQTGVVVGEHAVTTGAETNATRLYRVSECNIHPQYNPNVETTDNVAVCKIKGTITYSAEIGPVCLPFQHKFDSFEGATVTMLGWGMLDFGGAKSSVLQKVDVKVVPITTCRKFNSETKPLTLCTYATRKGSCHMDTGGPILWQNPVTSRIVLIGINSVGKGCGSNEPDLGVYIGHYIDWIESVTPGVEYCKVE